MKKESAESIMDGRGGSYHAVAVAVARDKSAKGQMHLHFKLEAG